VSLALWGCKTSRSGYESAPYSVALKDGDYELRDYPELTIVETSMADANAGENSGFRKLFGYITGKNQNQESIAMTTPVFISDDRRKMAFVLPAKSSSGQISAPLDPSLSIKKIPAGRFAVLRFSGGRSSTLETQSLSLLRTWIAKKGLTAAGSPIYGYFDPPWTPGFLRRNEVMLRQGD
jgi:DNA gyrase inhibitor GyrI